MKRAFCIILTVLLASAVCGQETLKSNEEEYYDFLSLKGIVERPTLGYRTLSDSVWNVSEGNASSPVNVWSEKHIDTSITLFTCPDIADNAFTTGLFKGLKLNLFGPDWFNSYNRKFPFGQNDGALWQGVGYNTSFSAGVRLEGFGIEAVFKPVITFSQNKPYTYLTGPHGGQYGYYAENAEIDIVQRYGESPIQSFSWGDSEIRLTWNTLTVGYGTQTPWLGASWLNPMMGSNNADPYPKFDIGVRKTAIIIPYFNTYLGDFEGRVWVGRLKQSNYFNYRNEKDRMATMGSFSFTPAGDMGLTVGFNRLFLTYWDMANLSYIKRLFTLSTENGNGTATDEDQKVAVFADWLLPDSGFEVYGEFGIDDFSANVFPNPFHTGIFTIGIKQAFTHSDHVYGKINLEWNSFEMSQDFQLQWMYGGFYYHGSVHEGFTNNGQVVGAGSGSFGNSQYIGYTLYYPQGKTTISAHRYCPDNNYIFNKAVVNNGTTGLIKWHGMYKTYLAGGLDSTYFMTPSLAVSAGGKLLMDVFPDYTANNGQWRTSWNLSFGLKYTY